MEISTSDLIAASAFLVSIASAYYSKRQSELAGISSQNDYRAHLSEHHERYRTLLTENMTLHREELRSLSRLASSAINTIIDLFDIHDGSERHTARPLRHLVHESSEMIYYSLKGQMTWQTGLNLSFRLAHFSRIEGSLSLTKNNFNNGDFRRTAEKIYRHNPNCYLESILSSDKYFCSLIEEIKQRIEKSKGRRLLLEQQESLKSLSELWDSLKPSFERSHQLLEKTLETNDMEQFPLYESPRLYRKFRQWTAKLDILVHINFNSISEEYADRYYNFISICIHNCAILHALQGVESWGWDND